mgnify:FL=1
MKESDARTTIYKRDVDVKYNLKGKSARALLGNVSKNFPTMPFSLRMIEDERVAKAGIIECTNHKLVVPYPVLKEREGAKIARFQTTVLILPTGPLRVAGLDFPAYFQSEKEPNDEAKEILEELKAKAAKKLAKKNKKKKKKAAA